MPLDGVDTVAILTTALRGKERGNDMMSWQGRGWGGGKSKLPTGLRTRWRVKGTLVGLAWSCS